MYNEAGRDLIMRNKFLANSIMMEVKSMKEKICLIFLSLILMTTVACGDENEQDNLSQGTYKNSEVVDNEVVNNEETSVDEKITDATKESSSQSSSLSESSSEQSENNTDEYNQMEVEDSTTSAGNLQYTENYSEESQNTGSATEEVRGTYDIGGYTKYKNAYINSSTDGLTGDEITFYNNLKACLDSAANCSRMVDKEKAVYDWIILNCHYDTAENHGAYTYKPEGVFIYGEAVCDGYTKAMKLCMDILDIPCTRVVGYASGNLHSWNNIILDDGCWYEVDVTWGDPLPDREGRISYQYFNVTSEYMGQTHYNYESNNCTATQYSYWNTFSNETYIRDYDAFYEYIIYSIKNGKTSGRVAFEHTVCRDFESAYDYTYVYSNTGINAIYKIDKIYEDNGTTHYPNGSEYADITFYYGTMDEEEIKFISSQSDMDSIIENLPLDEAANFCFCIDAENYAKGDFTKQHILDITTKTIVNYYISKESYNYLIHIGFAYCEEIKTATSLERIDELVDEMMGCGQNEMYITYHYGENSSRTDTVYNRISSRLQTNHGLKTNEYSINFYSSSNKSYRIVINIQRAGD